MRMKETCDRRRLGNRSAIRESGAFTRRLRFGLGLLLLLLPAAGCAQQLSDRQITLLSNGETAFERQRYSEAIGQLSQFIEITDPERPEVGRALYVRGMSYAKSGRRPDAFRDLRQVVASMGDVDVVWRSYFVLGTMYYEDRDWPQAAVTLRAATYRMPARPPKDFALFHLGECYERQGRWQQARGPYEEIADGFPSGHYGVRARQKLTRSATYFAVQAGSFAVEKNAETLREQLRGKNLPAYLRQEYYHRTLRHVVLVGQYVSYDDAERMVTTVRAEAGDALVWP